MPERPENSLELQVRFSQLHMILILAEGGAVVVVSDIGITRIGLFQFAMQNRRSCGKLSQNFALPLDIALVGKVFDRESASFEIEAHDLEKTEAGGKKPPLPVFKAGMSFPNVTFKAHSRNPGRFDLQKRQHHRLVQPHFVYRRRLVQQVPIGHVGFHLRHEPFLLQPVQVFAVQLERFFIGEKKSPFNFTKKDVRIEYFNFLFAAKLVDRPSRSGPDLSVDRHRPAHIR